MVVMKQIYYAIQSTLHGRGSNVTKVISLSLGLTIGVLLFSQIAFELNYEKCYPDADRLVLVRGGGENVKTGEKGEGYDDSLFAPMAEAFRSDLSQWIENATVIFNFETLNVFKDGHKLKDVNYAYVDTCYFRTFGIKVLKGNPEELQRAGSIFVSETFVRDAFGGQDPVGQKLSLDKQHELTVRGVYQDTPENTAYHFDFVAPIYAGGGYIGGGTWGRNDIYYTILRLRDGVDREEINRQIYKAMQKYYPDSADDEWRNFYDAPFYQLLMGKDSNLDAEGKKELAHGVFASTGGNPSARQLEGLIRTAKDATFHLGFDMDEAGQKFAEQFKALADREGVSRDRIVQEEPSEEYKDFNDELLDHKISAGIDFDSDGDVEVNESEEKQYHRHR